jgi:hypothetical protein
LIVHQRYEWRDNHRYAMTRLASRNGRDLKAQRLSATRGHEHQRITTRDDVVNDSALLAPKAAVAKGFLKDRKWRRRI